MERSIGGRCTDIYLPLVGQAEFSRCWRGRLEDNAQTFLLIQFYVTAQVKVILMLLDDPGTIRLPLKARVEVMLIQEVVFPPMEQVLFFVDNAM